MINIPMNTKPPVSLGDMAAMQSSTPTNGGNIQNTTPVNNMAGSNYGSAPVNNMAQPNYGSTPVNNMTQPNYGSAPVNSQAQVTRPASSGVILQKGQKTSLAKFGNALEHIDVGLGWDVANTGVYDLDSECFILGDNDKVLGDDWFVYYNQPASPDGSIIHQGDNRTGEGSGDDEVISVHLSRVNPQAKKLVFVVTINEAKERNLNFSGVQNAYIRLVDKSNNRELCRFNLTEYYSTVTSMMVAELYRHNGEWKLNPVGDGIQADLYDLCVRYGVNVAG